MKTLISIAALIILCSLLSPATFAGTVKKSQTFGIGGNGDELDVPFTIANVSSGNITEIWSDNRGDVGTAQTYAPGISEDNFINFGTANLGGSGTIVITLDWYPGSSASGTPFEIDTITFTAPGTEVPLIWPFAVCYTNSPVYSLNVPTNSDGDIVALRLNAINNNHLSTGYLIVNGNQHAVTYQNGLTTDANGSAPAGLTDLNSIIGGSASDGMFIDSEGDVSGTATLTGNVNTIFFYSASSSTSTNLTESANVTPLGMNNSGNVVGYGALDTSGDEHAIVYIGQFPYDLQTRGYFPSGTLDSQAFAINGSNVVSGTYSDGTHAHAFTWANGSSTVTTLPDGGYTGLAATSINDEGIETGTGYDSMDNHVAVYWDTAGIHTITDGSASNQQSFVNNFNQFLCNDDNSFWIASPNTTLIEINGLLTDSLEYIVPGPLNDLGEIAGYMSDNSGLNPCIFTPELPTEVVNITGSTDGSGTYSGSAKVTVVSTPNTGQTISGTYYSLDGGAYSAYTSPITVSTYGSHSFSSWCADQYGNSSGGNLYIFSVAPPLTSLTISPNTVTSKTTTTGTVTLAAPAPSGGAVISLSSSNSHDAVPSTSTVTIAAGATTANFSIYTANSGNSPVTITISATYLSVVKTATVTVNPLPAGLALQSLTISPSTVTAGTHATGTVTLNQTAPTGGIVVALSSSNSHDAVPAVSSVTVPAGSTSANFTIYTANSSTSAVTITLSAALNGVIKTATITVNPVITLTKLTINPSTVTSASKSTGTVTISPAAPAGGIVVTLSTTNSHVAVPAVSSVTVPAGSTTANFTINVANSGNAPVTVTLSATYGSVTKTANITVNPVPPGLALMSLGISPSTVTAGTHATGTVTLTQAAPVGGIVVAISSSNTKDAVPAVPSVTVASGATTATFTIYTANGSGSPSTVTLDAEYNNVVKTATIVVNP